MPWWRAEASKSTIAMSNVDEAELERLRRARIFVAGHQGMVGSAIVRQLEANDCQNLPGRAAP